MTLTASQAGYPVRLTGELDPNLSRWLWLVRMFLAIPHYIVLAFLWVAFLVTTVIAGFAILFTGRYPPSFFDFNASVLRWRVGFYVYAALGTDRYPPFTLARADYPADFDVAYPEHLSRGLVLIKWLLSPFVPVDRQHRLDLWLPARRRTLSPQPARRHQPLVLPRLSYVALMRDEYPPFRLDQGAHEPGDLEPDRSDTTRALVSTPA
jgi:hypothetical protein